MTSPHKNSDYIGIKIPTTSAKMQLLVAFSFTVSGRNVITAKNSVE